MAKFCGECGERLVSGARFCPECGAPAAGGKASTSEVATTQPRPVTPAPTSPTDGAAGGDPAARRRRNLLAAAIGGGVVLVVALVMLVAALAGGGDGGDGGDAKNAASKDKKKPAATTTTIDPAVIKAEQDYRAFVERIENVLTQSAGGRGQVGSLVSGVENGCSIDPYDASQQIRTVIDNRTSILNQLSGLQAPPNPEAQTFYSLLQQALQSSIDADIQYKGWFDFLYTDYYYTFPVGCPSGTPPKNEAFDAARAADARSTTLKQQFVDAFNPVATRFGLQTWAGGDF